MRQNLQRVDWQSSALWFSIISLVLVSPVLATTINLAKDTTTNSYSASYLPIDRNLVSWSFEDKDFPVYSRNTLARNFFDVLHAKTGAPPLLRIGGGASDRTIYTSQTDRDASSYIRNGVQVGGQPVLSPGYFDSFKNYYASGTQAVFCINFRNDSNNFQAGVQTALGTIENLNTDNFKLTAIEIGNEPDFYGNKGYRPNIQTWNATTLTAQWFQVAKQITSQHPDIKFQAGGFANPPWSVTQDFNTPGLVRAKLSGPSIPTYSMHFYPQSGCDHRLGLDDLMNHTYLLSNLTDYAENIQAAQSVGADFIIGESNSVSCGGLAGISDTLGAALWMVDYALSAASMGIKRIHFHVTPNSPYVPFIPKDYNLGNDSVKTGFLPMAYASVFLAEVLASTSIQSIAPISNQSDLSGYAIYANSTLEKLVFLNLTPYNSSDGTINNSTLYSTSIPSSFQRPTSTVTVNTSWEAGTNLSFIVLQGPGSNAKSMVNVSDFTFKSNGLPATDLKPTTIQVGESGAVSFEFNAAEAVLLQPTLITRTFASNKPNTTSSPKHSLGTTNVNLEYMVLLVPFISVLVGFLLI